MKCPNCNGTGCKRNEIGNRSTCGDCAGEGTIFEGGKVFIRPNTSQIINDRDDDTTAPA